MLVDTSEIIWEVMESGQRMSIKIHVTCVNWLNGFGYQEKRIKLITKKIMGWIYLWRDRRKVLIYKNLKMAGNYSDKNITMKTGQKYWYKFLNYASIYI